MSKNDGLLIGAAIIGAVLLAKGQQSTGESGGSSGGLLGGLIPFPIGDGGGGSMINLPDISLPDMNIPGDVMDIETIIAAVRDEVGGVVGDLAERVTNLENVEMPDMFNTGEGGFNAGEAWDWLNGLLGGKLSDFIDGVKDSAEATTETVIVASKNYGAPITDTFAEIAGAIGNFFGTGKDALDAVGDVINPPVEKQGYILDTWWKRALVGIFPPVAAGLHITDAVTFTENEILPRINAGKTLFDLIPGFGMVAPVATMIDAAQSVLEPNTNAFKGVRASGSAGKSQPAGKLTAQSGHTAYRNIYTTAPPPAGASKPAEKATGWYGAYSLWGRY